MSDTMRHVLDFYGRMLAKGGDPHTIAAALRIEAERMEAND